MIQDIAPHKLNNQYMPAAEPGPDDLVFAVRPEDDAILVALQGTEVIFPTAASLQTGAGALTYLLSIDESRLFLARRPEELTAPAGFAWYQLRQLRQMHCGPQHIIFTAYTAKQLSDWYRDNVWCGRCGQKTVHSEKERALVCPHCKKTVYPRLNPAVIVGVTDGDRIVVTKYAGRNVPYYALIAGFTEIGETLEETVQREVMEEVGLKVRNIRYYKSQPWAMADDILMGFYCDVDGDTTITMDASELKEALWVKREDVILQPDTYSLTNEMMTLFREGRESRVKN